MSSLSTALLQNRIIYMTGVLTSENTKYFIGSLLYLNISDELNSITLYINGKSMKNYPYSLLCDHLFSIHDLINRIDKTITTICIGSAINEFCVMSSYGSKVAKKEVALPNSYFLIDFSDDYLYGMQASDMEIAKSEILKLRFVLCNLMEQHTLKNLHQIHNDVEKPVLLSSIDAINFGIIDRLI